MNFQALLIKVEARTLCPQKINSMEK